MFGTNKGPVTTK